MALGLLAFVIIVLAATGRVLIGSWPLVVAVGLAARPVWWCIRLAWSAWWQSPSHHAAVVDAAPEAPPLDDEPEVAGLALTHVRWREPPPQRPLVRPGQQRTVAALLAGRTVPGEIDVVETVRRVASRRPLWPVPRHRRWSTNQGMHLHVDMGPALEPFREDVEHLRADLVAVASPHGVVELGFDSDPLQITWPPSLAGYGDRVPLARCVPPSGTSVLVVSDLGIAVPRSGSPCRPGQLLAQFHLLDQAGCTVRYLVPYPPERWPPQLRRLPILYWSDGLGAGDVLAAMRRGQGR